MPLHQALSYYPALFDSVMIHMVNAGQEAGALTLSLQILAQHLETKQNFYKKIRAAALLPVLSFFFFISIALVIFIVIMPLFIPIFESMQQEVPTLTQWLMQVSEFLRSFKVVAWTGALGSLLWLGYVVMGKKKRKQIIDKLALQVPGIRIITVYSATFSFRSVATLLSGGVQLVPALHISKQAVNNAILREQLDDIKEAVAAGNSLQQALVLHPGPFSRPDIEAMVTVAEESGQLASMLATIADDQHERLERTLSLYSMLVQPCLMIILGVLIALLIVAVYIPILSLSYAIS